jgi:hypothetical protein
MHAEMNNEQESTSHYPNIFAFMVGVVHQTQAYDVTAQGIYLSRWKWALFEGAKEDHQAYNKRKFTGATKVF